MPHLYMMTAGLPRAFDFETDEGMTAFTDSISQAKEKNIREGMTLTKDDSLITLSTCTDKETERYLVVAALESKQFTENGAEE